jgi:hypothetical protein
MSSNENSTHDSKMAITRPSLATLPVEIQLQILFDSLSPALLHTSSRLRNNLPPYVAFTKAIAAIATCPEGPSEGLMKDVYERVMTRYYHDIWQNARLLPLSRRWEIREKVWRSSWFTSTYFEKIVLELYREFLDATSWYIKKPVFSDDLLRFRRHAARCQSLDTIMGEEFVAGLPFRIRRPGAKRRIRVRKGDLLITFNQIGTTLCGREQPPLQFWGAKNLYDLPDGLFGTPMTPHQVRQLRFLTTLDWHWKSHSMLAQRASPALANAVSWAIQSQHATCLDVLLRLYHRYVLAGNTRALNIRRHIRECSGQNVVMLKTFAYGIMWPHHVLRIIDEMTTRSSDIEGVPMPETAVVRFCLDYYGMGDLDESHMLC